MTSSTISPPPADEMLLEEIQRIIAGRVVRGQGGDFLDAVLDRPIGDDGGGLRQREAGAHDVGRAFGNDRGAGRHHDLGYLALRGQRRRCQRGRRHAKSGDDVDLVVDDQFLRQPLGIVGKCRIVLQDHFDLLAGDGVAVLLHVQLDRVVDLLAGRSLTAGHRQDQADLHGVLRMGRRQRPGKSSCEGERGCRGNAGRALRQHPGTQNPGVPNPGTNQHQRSPLIGLMPLNRVPGPCRTITRIFQPCIGTSWRLKHAALSIATMDGDRWPWPISSERPDEPASRHCGKQDEP